MDATPQNILIVRLSAIGDVVHSLPAVHALRDQFPQAHIGWLVEELSAPLLQDYPDIDSLHVIPKKRWRAAPLRHWINGEKPAFYGALRREKWDCAIDFQGLTKSGWSALLSGARSRVGYGDHDGRELNKIFTNQRVRPNAKAVHVIQRNMELLRPLGIKEPEIRWDFPEYPEAEISMGRFIREALGGAGYVGWNPGAGWTSKRWPPEHFGRAARMLHEKDGRPQLMVWGPGEEELCRAMRKASGLNEEQLQMAPPNNLRELATLLRHASLLVAGDTGPLHLAAALGTPCVALQGATDPMRNGPWGKGHTIFYEQDAPCVGCWKTHCDYVPHLDCMHRITPEAVAQAVHEASADNPGV